MYILWINCLHSGDNAPQQVPRAGELAGVLNGALSPECKQVYPQGYTQGSKTAAFTLIHRDDDDCGHVPLVVPFRQSIGIDWFEKIQPKSRRSTRAIRAPGYESRPGKRNPKQGIDKETHCRKCPEQRNTDHLRRTGKVCILRTSPE